MKKINQLSKNLFLNFKFIYSNPKILVKLFLISMLLLLLPIFIFPLHVCSSIIFEFSIILSGGIIFGTINYEWRNSTMYKNYCTLRSGRLIYYGALFSITLIVSIILVNLMILVLFILYKLNLLMGEWYFVSEKGGFSYDFSLLPFIGFYYSFFWMNIISFLILYIFNSFSKTQKTYYMFIIILMILVFLFGGMLNNYFLRLKRVKVDDYYVFQEFKKFLYPEWFFIPSLLFPLYAPGQIMNFTFHFAKTHNGVQIMRYTDFLNHLNVIQWVPINSITGIDARNWDIVLIMPAIWTASLILMSLFISFVKKNSILI